MSTRTRNGYFYAPHLGTGNVHFEDEVYEARDGVVECPLEVAEGAHWPLATAEQVHAYKASAAATVVADEVPTTVIEDTKTAKAKK